MNQPQSLNPTRPLEPHAHSASTPGAEVMDHPPIRWLKPAAIAGVCLAAIVVGAGIMSRLTANHEVKTWTATEAIPNVTITHPIAQTGTQPLILPGQVDAFYAAPIHARVPGYLKIWYTDIGAQVHAGQLMAVIDTPDLDQELIQAKADLATAVANEQLARTTANRWNNLLAQDAVSRQDADVKNGDLAAKTALVNAARARVGRLEALEGFKLITAPFDGVVTARTTDIGQLITVGNVNDPGLFTVSDVHRLRIYVSVPQAYTSQIHDGQTVSLQVPEHPGQSFQATLVSTSGAVGTRSGAVLAEAQIDNNDNTLKPGDYAQVTFNLRQPSTAVTLPANTLIFLHDGMNVAVVGPNDRVTLKHVIIAQDNGPTVSIATGLSPDDRVIENPPDSVVNGELVRISTPKPAPAQGAAG